MNKRSWAKKQLKRERERARERERHWNTNIVWMSEKEREEMKCTQVRVCEMDKVSLPREKNTFVLGERREFACVFVCALLAKKCVCACSSEWERERERVHRRPLWLNHSLKNASSSFVLLCLVLFCLTASAKKNICKKIFKSMMIFKMKRVERTRHLSGSCLIILEWRSLPADAPDRL